MCSRTPLRSYKREAGPVVSHGGCKEGKARGQGQVSLLVCLSARVIALPLVHAANLAAVRLPAAVAVESGAASARIAFVVAVGIVDE